MPNVTEKNTSEQNHESTSGDYDWQGIYRSMLGKVPVEDKPFISSFFRSSFMYIVLENEMSLENKRRVVSLSSHDLLYSSITGKCVFMPIDLNKDFTNTIKVHEDNHTWETTFSELIATRPMALLNLFSRSEVWAEGHYSPLAR